MPESLFDVIYEYLTAQGWEHYTDDDGAITDTWLLPDRCQIDSDDIIDVVRWQLRHELESEE